MREIILKLLGLDEDHLKDRVYQMYNKGKILFIYDKNTKELIKVIKYVENWSVDDVKELAVTGNKYLGTNERFYSIFTVR